MCHGGEVPFELRRWPRESGLLTDGLPPTPVNDGQYIPGTASPIASARLRIGDFVQTQSPDAGRQAVTFTVPLKPGDSELQTWFLDAANKEILGAILCLRFGNAGMTGLVS